MPEIPVPLRALDVDLGPPRVCGRCRLVFDGDPTLHTTALPQWWVCPTCRAVLLPNRRQTGEIVALHRPGGAS